MGERTLLLLSLFLCSNQAFTEFLLLLVEACGTVWRDVGERGSSRRALCGSGSGERSRADCASPERRQAIQRTCVDMSGEHGRGGGDGGAVELRCQLTKPKRGGLGRAKAKEANTGSCTASLWWRYSAVDDWGPKRWLSASFSHADVEWSPGCFNLESFPSLSLSSPCHSSELARLPEFAKVWRLGKVRPTQPSIGPKTVLSSAVRPRARASSVTDRRK
jgi:hypothetical protein